MPEILINVGVGTMTQKAVGFKVGYNNSLINKKHILDSNGQLDHNKLVCEIDKMGQKLYQENSRFGRY